MYKENIWLPVGIIGILITGFLSNDLYLPSMPTLTEVFNIPANLMQGTVTAWLIGSMVCQLILGPVSDVYGRRPILLASTFLLFLASGLCALSTQITFFMLGRLLQGAAVSGMMVAGYAAIHETYTQAHYPFHKATQMMGIVGMSTSLAPIMGPLLGGYIFTYINWQANFYVVVLLSIVFLLILWRTMPETRLPVKHTLNAHNIINEYKKLLKNPLFLTSILAYGFIFGAGGAYITSAAFLFIDIAGLLPEQMGFAFIPLIGCYMITCGFAGHISKHTNEKFVIGIALGIASIAMLIFLFTSMITQTLVSMMIPLSVYYICLGLISPPLGNLALSYAADAKGAGAALLTFSLMTGCTLGSLLISLFYNGSLFSIVMVIAIFVFIATGCYLFSLRKLSSE